MMEKLFFELVCVAIGRQEHLSRIPTIEEWLFLYQMAEKQSLLGACFAGVKILKEQGMDVPANLFYQWLGITSQILHQNDLVNAQCAETGFKIQDSCVPVVACDPRSGVWFQVNAEKVGTMENSRGRDVGIA